MHKYLMISVIVAMAWGASACSKADVATTPDAATVVVPSVAGAVAPASSPTEEACTWQTPLEPGIPGSPDNLIASPINPNGQSELAALMREMESHMKAVRLAIANGTPLPAVSDRQQKIRCSWPTTASDRNAAFDAFAVSYDAALKGLYAAPAGEAQKAAYAGVLTTCRTCHENSCPGPIMAIDALKLDRLAAP